MAAEFGETIIQQSKSKQSAVMFILHGLGSSGSALSHIGPDLELPHVKFVYPTAPAREVTISNGAKQNAWFDIAHPDLMGVRDAPSVSSSVAYVNRLIATEVANGTPENRIVLGGFSQGGHISLRAACQLKTPLAAAIGLSTWCESPEERVCKEVQQMPVFIGHGKDDMLVPVILAQKTAEGLKNSGMQRTELHVYPGLGHSTEPQEMADLRVFLQKAIPDLPPTRAEVDSMSLKELRSLLGSRGVSTLGFLEKHEFLDAARDLAK